MEIKIGGKYLTKSGEAMRIFNLDLQLDAISIAVQESDFIIEGLSSNVKAMFSDTGVVEITDPEYKRRTVAMRMFQDMKKNEGYRHKTYHGQYDEIKILEDSEIESAFVMGGGYRDYSKAEKTEFKL